MTPNAYAAARRLAADPRTPAHERASAALRVAEYEKKHGKPAACPILTPEERVFWRTPRPRRYRPDEHCMTAICARCGKDFAWHYMASAMDRPISCGEFVLTPQAPPQPTTGPRIPWWALKVYVKDGPRAGRPLGLTTEFRQVLRSLKRKEAISLCYRVTSPRRCTWADIDWTHFPERERGSGKAPWRPPPEMREAMRKTKGG